MQEDSYQGSCTVAGALPPWLRGTLFRAGPGLWEVGERQLRHVMDGFAVIGTINFCGDGSGEVLAHQRFVDNEPYRAARRGRLIVDKFASRRRFEGWGAWAQERIRVRGLSLNRVVFMITTRTPRSSIRDVDSLNLFPFAIPLSSSAGRQWCKVL